MPTAALLLVIGKLDAQLATVVLPKSRRRRVGLHRRRKEALQFLQEAAAAEAAFEMRFHSLLVCPRAFAVVVENQILLEKLACTQRIARSHKTLLSQLSQSFLQRDHRAMEMH